MRELVARARSSWLACFGLALAGAFLPRMAFGATCDWVESVTSWSGSFSWSWTHQDLWLEDPSPSVRVTTWDAGGGSAAPLTGLLGTFSGSIDGTLAFDELYEIQSTGSPDVSFGHSVLSGAIIGPSQGSDSMLILEIDDFACTYTWSTVGPYGAGTFTSEVGSQALEFQPNQILPGTHPIPPLPGPLSFSGAVPVTSNPEASADPQFVTYADGASSSLGRIGAPVPADASVSWSFEPGNAQAPSNDACAGARFLLDDAQQDTSSATVDAADPASSCGGDDRSVWFTFFATGSGLAQISTAGSDYSTVVSVWPAQQICGALAGEVACGANGASVPVQEGTAYRVQVRRSGTGEGGVLSVQIVPEAHAMLNAIFTLVALAGADRRRRSRAQRHP